MVDELGGVDFVVMLLFSGVLILKVKISECYHCFFWGKL